MRASFPFWFSGKYLTEAGEAQKNAEEL